MNKYIQILINEIDVTDGIRVREIVNTFEKKIKKEINKHYYTIGLEDHALDSLDYIILYYIWKNCNVSIDIEDLLVLIYSFYKLEEFYFDTNVFNLDTPFDVLNKSNISSLLLNVLYIING
tara:strand:- start:2383 stop:2745 length:363 start_codon:yes stop_codon:yes gene_type:complete